MSYTYSVSEFYMLLKLGVWQSGTAQFWGEANVIPEGNSFFFPGDLAIRYTPSSLIRKHLDTGIYLLDVFYMGKEAAGDRRNYRLIVAVCRNDMTHLDALYHIQVCNTVPMRDFLAALSKDDAILGSRLRKKSLFNHPSRIQTNLEPIWSKFIFRR